MRKITGLILGVLMVVGLVGFVRQWRYTTAPAYGTGDIAGNSADRAARDSRGIGTKMRERFRNITQNPLRYQDQRVTVTGRVRGATKLASNRNIYTLTQGDYRLLVIDDKAPPREYWPRTVNGTVKVIGPPVGGLQYAYVTDVREPAKFNAPRWQDIKHYFDQGPNG
jgi:hypothetical protein